MYTTLVYVTVKAEFTADFIKATVKNHESSIKEKGNLRFDVLQNGEDASSFVLYEAYESEQYAKAHKETPHYHEWRETVADWMAAPRKGVQYNGIRP